VDVSLITQRIRQDAKISCEQVESEGKGKEMDNHHEQTKQKKETNEQNDEAKYKENKRGVIMGTLALSASCKDVIFVANSQTPPNAIPSCSKVKNAPIGQMDDISANVEIVGSKGNLSINIQENESVIAPKASSAVVIQIPIEDIDMVQCLDKQTMRIFIYKREKKKDSTLSNTEMHTPKVSNIKSRPDILKEQNKNHQQNQQKENPNEFHSFVFQLESEMELMTWTIGLVSTKSAFLSEWRKDQNKKEISIKELNQNISSSSPTSVFPKEYNIRDQQKLKKFCANEETFLLWQCGRLLLLEKIYEYGFFEGLKLFQKLLSDMEEEYQVNLSFPITLEAS